jgi:hypothetical protein
MNWSKLKLKRNNLRCAIYLLRNVSKQYAKSDLETKVDIDCEANTPEMLVFDLLNNVLDPRLRIAAIHLSPYKLLATKYTQKKNLDIKTYSYFEREVC